MSHDIGLSRNGPPKLVGSHAGLESITLSHSRHENALCSCLSSSPVLVLDSPFHSSISICVTFAAVREGAAERPLPSQLVVTRELASVSAFAPLLLRHNTYLQECTGQREPTYQLNIHDIKLLFLRFAMEQSFSADTGGGGRESNIHLIPYIIHTVLYVLNTSVPPPRAAPG